VQEVVEPGQELERAVAIAERIAKQAPLGVFATLRNARVAMTKGPEVAIAELHGELAPLMRSDDARDGLMSFVERREARLAGKESAPGRSAERGARWRAGSRARRRPCWRGSATPARGGRRRAGSRGSRRGPAAARGRARCAAALRRRCWAGARPPWR